MQRNTEFTVRDLITLLKVRVVMIAAVTATAVLLSLIYSMFLVQPLYKCTTTLIVRVEQSSSSVANASAQIADTFGYILKNEALVERVISELDIDINADKLAENITFSEVESTGIYKLTVQAGSEALADAVTGAFIKYVPEEISLSLKPDSIEIITLSKDVVQVAPNTLSNAATGFFVGLALACVIALLMELLNNRFKSTVDVKSHLDYPVIGVVPQVGPSVLLPYGLDKSGRFAEAFNALQAVIHYARQNKPLKTIIIISPQPGDGRTAVVLNLAAAMRTEHSSILLVDADYRTPGLSGILYPNKPDANGLSAVLSGSTRLADCVQSLDGVDVLISGPAPNKPSEALQSEAMRSFIEEASRSYDTILFDVPALTMYSDAVTLLPLMDVAIFVVRHNYTTFEAAAFAKERMELVNTCVIGCVMNAFDTRTSNKVYTYEPPAGKARTKLSQTLAASYRTAKAYLKTSLSKKRRLRYTRFRK